MLKTELVRAFILGCVVMLASCAQMQAASSDPDADVAPVSSTEQVQSQAQGSPEVVDPELVLFPSVESGALVKPAKSASSKWRHHRLPGKKMTQYKYERTDGRHAIKARAGSSASMLRHAVRVAPHQLNKLQFSWKVPALIDGADLFQRETHDSPVRVVLVFEGDRSKFSAKNAMLSELAKTLTGEELPYATLMYVWCNSCATDTTILSPRTDRIRELALESGEGQLNRWMEYKRDIRADYEKAFGEPPGALLAVGIMTDTDNTHQNASAWYGPISLSD